MSSPFAGPPGSRHTKPRSGRLTIQERFDEVDASITSWMARYGVWILRHSLGVVFFWFGVLKFFPGLSPAEQLATRTIAILTFGAIKPAAAILILATWETLIGLGLMFDKWMRLMRVTLFLLFVQMVGTILPLVFFPFETFYRFPYAPTLEGQYIIKNIVLISAAIVIGATVRGGRLSSEPTPRQPTLPRPRRYTPPASPGVEP